jgi:hypothetical protein
VLSLRLATGIILFANKNEIPPIRIAIINNGCIKRSKAMPADFMATNSKLSPKCPNVIIDESKRASGKARGTIEAAYKPINFEIIEKSSPLPTRSSIYSHKNCITNTNNAIKKVAKNGPVKAFIIKASSFLITLHKVYPFKHRISKNNLLAAVRLAYAIRV